MPHVFDLPEPPRTRQNPPEPPRTSQNLPGTHSPAPATAAAAELSRLHKGDESRFLSACQGSRRCVPAINWSLGASAAHKVVTDSQEGHWQWEQHCMAGTEPPGHSAWEKQPPWSYISSRQAAGFNPGQAPALLPLSKELIYRALWINSTVFTVKYQPFISC